LIRGFDSHHPLQLVHEQAELTGEEEPDKSTICHDEPGILVTMAAQIAAALIKENFMGLP
jgi:hypothetical protein